MEKLRRAALLLLIPLLVALSAAPVLASGNGTPKTNQEHENWLELDPVPAVTSTAQTTLTGRVAGNFDMEVWNGWHVTRFEAKGNFSVTVPLQPGANRLRISGKDKAGRLLNAQVTVVSTFDGSSGDPGNGDPGSGDPGSGDPGSGDPGSGDPGSGTAYPGCGNAVYEGRDYNQHGSAVQFNIEFGCGTLKADGQSQFTLVIVVVDDNGLVTPSYHEPITTTTSDPSAITIGTPVVIPEFGIAQVTLIGGTVVAPTVVRVSAPNLGSIALTLTPMAP